MAVADMDSRSRTMTVEEFAEVAGIGRRLAYEQAAQGQLPVPVIRIGRRMVIPRAAVERLFGEGDRTG